MTAFESGVLRIFGRKTEEMAGKWRRLHNELHNLYASTSVIRVFKPRWMSWTGHVAHTGEMQNAYKNSGRKT